ncbi:H-2 class II histocompatibility antigen [Huso huso]|uniref:H-2 class II histocompatibility antigen n=1 Tax=Huso huso TaxID=61971 RepID=A0ABR0YAR0_HUSHU
MGTSSLQISSLYTQCLRGLVLLSLMLCCRKPSFGVEGYLMQTMVDCEYSDSSMADMVLSWRYVFNQQEVVHYDSKIKKFVGNTACGVKDAETWNKDKDTMAQLLGEVDRYCKHNMGLHLSFTTDRKIPPAVRVRSIKPFSSQHQTMLVCNIIGFYPREIKVTWLRNGVKVTADVSSSELLPDGDWTYQIHSYLELTPQSGDSYTCRVEHSALAEAIEEKWDPTMPESKRNKIIIGTSGIVLGLVIAAAGLIYYKKKATGRSTRGQCCVCVINHERGQCCVCVINHERGQHCVCVINHERGQHCVCVINPERGQRFVCLINHERGQRCVCVINHERGQRCVCVINHERGQRCVCVINHERGQHSVCVINHERGQRCVCVINHERGQRCVCVINHERGQHCVCVINHERGQHCVCVINHERGQHCVCNKP